MTQRPTELDAPVSSRMPDAVEAVFWDVDVETLSWTTDRELIIRRVLCAGSWEAVTWLRDRLGDDALRAWIEREEGSALSPRQLRFWEVVLGLPSDRVDEWVRRSRSSIWESRVAH